MKYKVDAQTGWVVTNDEREDVVLVTTRVESGAYASALNSGISPDDDDAIEAYVRKENKV